ncbi:hypothetical protein PR003_g12019 [Phytophthora rubi]|uniref:Uncharacterized protein n=1 Tax=Phytophthora rubi TaxID=129364 RepID=A0A6A4FB17_9STRA|nr:hypothetical protein PR003_g12019 [Phytophthora rubi]
MVTKSQTPTFGPRCKEAARKEASASAAASKPN